MRRSVFFLATALAVGCMRTDASLAEDDDAPGMARAEVVDVRVDGDRGCIPVRFGLVHSGARPVDVAVHVGLSHTGAFIPATPAPGQLLAALATSREPPGIEHVFSWDSVADLPRAREDTVLLRVSATAPGGLFATAVVGGHAVDNGLLWTPRVDLQPCATACPPQSIAAADLDGDLDADLVIGSEYNGVVSVHLNDGGGTFAPPTDYPIEWDAADLEIADFDDDGRTDIAAISWNDNGVYVFWNNGGGSFANAAQYANTGPPYLDVPISFAATDFDGDGELDLIATGESNDVTVVYGQTGRAFSDAVPLVTGIENMYWLAAHDFDNDGAIDLVTTDWWGTLTLYLAANGFAPDPLTLEDSTLGGTPVGGALGDFDADGRMDIAVALPAAAAVAILLADASGVAFSRDDVPLAGGPTTLTAADLDGDGNLDLVVAYDSAGVVSTLLGNGNGTFSAPQHQPLPGTGRGSWQTSRTAVADFDGDGRLDIAATDPDANTVSLYFNVGEPATFCDGS